MTWLGIVLMGAGAVLGLLSGVGVVRLPTPLARVHAAAKPASLGLALVALGAGVHASSWGLLALAGLVASFQFLTAPIAGHLLGRSIATGSLPPAGPGTSRAPRLRRWPLVAQTAVIWPILWRDASLANVLAGLALGLALTLLIGPRPSPGRIRPLGMVTTAASYIGSLVAANLRMARQVLIPRPGDLEETIVTTRLSTESGSVAYFDANAISFSPGTLTLEITESPPYTMTVHALGQGTSEVDAEVAGLEESGRRMYE